MYIRYGTRMRYTDSLDFAVRLTITGGHVLFGFDTNDTNAPYALICKDPDRAGKIVIMGYCKTLQDANKCREQTDKAIQAVRTASINLADVTKPRER